MADPRIRFTPEMAQLREFIIKRKGEIDKQRTQSGQPIYNRSPEENQRVGQLANIDWMLWFLNDMARGLPVPQQVAPVYYVITTPETGNKFNGQHVHTHDDCPTPKAALTQHPEWKRLDLHPRVLDVIVWNECPFCVHIHELIPVQMSISPGMLHTLQQYIRHTRPITEGQRVVLDVLDKALEEALPTPEREEGA